jgi:DNA-binding NarL/FixJ family response regulator
MKDTMNRRSLPANRSSPQPDPLRVSIVCRTTESRKAVEAMLRALHGSAAPDPPEDEPDVTLYAARSPQELIALLGPEFEPRPHSLVLDLEGAIGPQVVALLGAPGYVRRNCPREHLQHCLREIARGHPYAQEPFDGLFHHTREGGPLTTEQKKILSLAAQGHSRERIGERLSIEPGTLRHRITTLRQRLGLRPNELLAVAAVRMGFPADPRG